MAFGQLRSEKVGQLKEQPKPKAEEAPNPIQTGNIGIVNLEQKKKPHNINIRNYNPNEPKTKANIKYSAKQSYRRYKTKTEPNLLSKIQINEDDDIVNKIKEAFGLQTDVKNSNYTKIDPAPAPFYKGIDDLPAEPVARRKDINELLIDFDDITADDFSELTFQPRQSLQLGSEYHFDTEFTPEKRVSRRERDLDEYNIGTFPEQDYPLTTALSTPTERALLNRMSEQLTPPMRMMRTPEERKKAREDAEKTFQDAELTLERLDSLSKAQITTRKVGRPSGPYGPYKKRSGDTEY